MTEKVCVYLGESLAKYGFGEGHPFGPDRHDAFVKEFKRQQLDCHHNIVISSPAVADPASIERFHTHAYVERVKDLSNKGEGYLDLGDTPAVPGIYEAASTVVGTVLDAVDQIMCGNCDKAFVPIAGLHHATRDSASGFCVFNDCGVAIESLKQVYGLSKIAYVDIDAHHGDGVFYSFVEDPQLIFADIHEDGHYLYPGTGFENETGEGAAKDTKLNLPVAPDSGDEVFQQQWLKLEAFIDTNSPEFILFQCGADSIAGDPITHLRFTERSHAYATQRLAMLADKHCEGRLLVLGGGGYNRGNIARAWCAVVKTLANAA
ncbi:hypothetical protein [Kaarinaea lacus]